MTTSHPLCLWRISLSHHRCSRRSPRPIRRGPLTPSLLASLVSVLSRRFMHSTAMSWEPGARLAVTGPNTGDRRLALLPCPRAHPSVSPLSRVLGSHAASGGMGYTVQGLPQRACMYDASEIDRSNTRIALTVQRHRPQKSDPAQPRDRSDTASTCAFWGFTLHATFSMNPVDPYGGLV